MAANFGCYSFSNRIKWGVFIFFIIMALIFSICFGVFKIKAESDYKKCKDAVQLSRDAVDTTNSLNSAMYDMVSSPTTSSEQSSSSPRFSSQGVSPDPIFGDDSDFSNDFDPFNFQSPFSNFPSFNGGRKLAQFSGNTGNDDASTSFGSMQDFQNSFSGSFLDVAMEACKEDRREELVKAYTFLAVFIICLIVALVPIMMMGCCGQKLTLDQKTENHIQSMQKTQTKGQATNV
eukprot:TRINITY_DN26819_c1_g1_i2.p1 TRINITY_DN26819_c1_g1~~TRINITY_DN26819_c1_g1_i2.p1  ORF type:complete len:233 (+),score=19.07 TRINITY_DN26819_c1_g1_i2:204-902(+)